MVISGGGWGEWSLVVGGGGGVISGGGWGVGGVIRGD